MNGKEDMTIAIIRMGKLLAGVSSKIRESIGKHGAQSSPLVQEIINRIELFRKSIIVRMKKTPDIERMHAINLRDCRTTITETLSELEVLQNTSVEQKSNFEIFLRDVTIHINNEEKLMRSIKETSEVDIPKEIEDSMLTILNVREQGEARKKLLQSEIDSAERRLHNIMEFNATTEKILLDNCAEVEQKLTDLLAKYDHDIGTCHTLMEKLTKEKELLNAEKKDMEDQLVVQRALYTQLKKEREITLMKAFTKKLELFKRNRAAKTIQKAWRAYFERISQRRRRKARRK
ncbi:PREDICTED: IQ domain-containing protein D-like [Dinoponera quadriceps]|uniref:Dynein regulatory complex protein 10 n=1 Tax=Dinoponera quadriceps TaxID=609295 RepID=A0A6P3Y0L2_DINQU|nr:PREDICTED: IQ domain-containing protein D-like [Dinoponera quadriceps]XP_014484347.1 PREDICTED: IQ domain-containing protein D-like [Dinoponera quadriceps]